VRQNQGRTYEETAVGGMLQIKVHIINIAGRIAQDSLSKSRYVKSVLRNSYSIKKRYRCRIRLSRRPLLKCDAKTLAQERFRSIEFEVLNLQSHADKALEEPG